MISVIAKRGSGKYVVANSVGAAVGYIWNDVTRTKSRPLFIQSILCRGYWSNVSGSDADIVVGNILKYSDGQ